MVVGRPLQSAATKKQNGIEKVCLCYCKCVVCVAVFWNLNHLELQQ